MKINIQESEILLDILYGYLGYLSEDKDENEWAENEYMKVNKLYELIINRFKGN